MEPHISFHSAAIYVKDFKEAGKEDRYAGRTNN